MTPEARAARERKQKIFVVIGGLVLLALLAFQLPKLLGGSGSSAAPATETTTVAGETGSATPSPTAAPAALVNTDPGLEPGPGQVGTFTVFKSKDPFVQQVVAPNPTAVQAPVQEPAAKPKPTAKGFKGRAVTAGKTTIVSVNGNRHVLEPGSTFPPANPVFVLVSEQPKAKTVVIGLPSGEYADGAGKRRLRAGTPLVLVNKATGKRYTLTLVAVGGAKPATGKNR
jgi:hypothetical protein